MISDVLFDLDDTLCDFSGAKRRGLDAAFALLSEAEWLPEVEWLPELERSLAQQRWTEDEPALYQAFAAGRISRDHYRFERFAMLVTPVLASHVPADRLQALVGEMNRAFMAEVNDRIDVMPGALDCLRELRSRSIRCHLLTNGPTDGQRRKIDRLGLRSFLDHVQIGEEVGVFKPDRAAFDLALRSIGRRADRVVMVGDSLPDDIEAAQAAGLRAVHFAPASSDADITDLADLADAIQLFGEVD